MNTRRRFDLQEPESLVHFASEAMVMQETGALAFLRPSTSYLNTLVHEEWHGLGSGVSPFLNTCAIQPCGSAIFFFATTNDK